MNYARSALKGIGIVADRFRSQGVGTTLLWVYARGVPKITGVPIIRYSEVTPQLFIGPQINKAGRRKLESVGIHNSVNLRVEHDDINHAPFGWSPARRESAHQCDQYNQRPKRDLGRQRFGVVG